MKIKCLINYLSTSRVVSKITYLYSCREAAPLLIEVHQALASCGGILDTPFSNTKLLVDSERCKSSKIMHIAEVHTHDPTCKISRKRPASTYLLLLYIADVSATAYILPRPKNS